MRRYMIKKDVNKDDHDPEALLQAVSMAGLVGLLRQLGDLAEFAAEIFHGLHEEAIATATRGRRLMIRAKQLDAQLPSIQTSLLLSQTNHTSFFFNSGIDWHPNLQTKQGLLSRGDLPRCVMDSYEQCRGPPRLFLVDKFDVDGAGACLKRYTDPSFFKAKTLSSGGLTGVYRERKVHKATHKRGPHWRNGHQALPKSHPNLQQLLTEDRVENGLSNSTRLVKLKRRQLHDPKPGRSYMEKFLGIPSPNNNMGRELVKVSVEELNEYVTDRQIVPLSEPTTDVFPDEVPFTQSGMGFEKELLVYSQGNIENSINGENYDDIASEVDKYMDAQANIESEVDTDNEYHDLSNAKEYRTFSDSQSVEISSVSDRNGSFKKERSSFSCSDSSSNLANNALYDEKAAPEVFSTIEIHEVLDDMSDMQSEDGMNETFEESDMNALLQPEGRGPQSLVISSTGPALPQSAKLDMAASNNDEIRTYTTDASVSTNNVKLDKISDLSLEKSAPTSSEPEYQDIESEFSRHSGNSFSASVTIEDAKLQHSPVSSSSSTWDDDNEKDQQNSSTLSAQKPKHDFTGLASKMSEHHSELNSATPITKISSSREGSISSDEKLIQPFQERYKTTKTRLPSTHNSEAEHDYPYDASASRKEEQSHLQTLEGLLARPSNKLALAPTFEVEKPNVNTVLKMPRPRSPLVDALAAHDKSTLRKVTGHHRPQTDDRDVLMEQFRKVTDRPRPQIEQKVNERDSLMEQIRAKNFTLKPAFVSKQSIQGPRTNLRVSAILEKANAIRQATAGSDEDEDDWSE
ncbi:hypothetical protein ACFE04_002639 [Oxalis oulophora]